MKILIEEFKFLETDFEFILDKKIKDTWGVEIHYKQKENEVGVKITYENRESCIYVMLYKLFENNFIENPRFITDKTILNSFSLGDIVNIKNPSDRIKPTYKYPEDHEYHDDENGLRFYARDFAANLKKHANEILKGDFEIWPQLDKVVRDRAREYGQYGKDIAHG